MTSKTSWDKRAKECALVYKFALRTGKSLGITLFCLCMLIGPVVTGLLILRQLMGNGLAGAFYTDNLALLQGEFYMGLGFLFIFLFMGNLFGYMHNRGAVDLFHALPLGRVPMLLGRFFAALTHLLVPMAAGLFLSALLTVLANGIDADAWVIFRTYGVLLAILFLMQFAFLAFSVFLCVCCGNTANTVLSILAINVGWCVLVLFSWIFLELSLPGLPDFLGVLPLLFLESPAYALLSPMAAGFSSLGVALFIDGGLAQHAFPIMWWAIFGVALFFLSLWLYKRRRSESAGEGFAFAVPRVVIRALIALTAAIVFGTAGAVYFGNAAISVGLLFVGLVLGHVLSEAVFQRGFSTQKKQLPALGITAAALVVAVVLVGTGGFGYVTRVPAAADVASIELDTRYFPYMPQLYYSVEGEDPSAPYISDSHRYAAEISTPDEVAAVRDAQANAVQSLSGPFLPRETMLQKDFQLTYHLKDGGTFERSYSLYEYPEMHGVLDTIAAQTDFTAPILVFGAMPPESITSGVNENGSNAVSLTPEQVSTLQKAFLEDQDDVIQTSIGLNGVPFEKALHTLSFYVPNSFPTAGNEILEKAFHTDKGVERLGSLDFSFTESGAPHLTAVCKDLGLL